MSAVADSSANFSGFTGAVSGAASPQSLNMNGPATVTANFTLLPDFTVGFNNPNQNLNPLTISEGGGTFVPIVVSAVGGFSSASNTRFLRSELGMLR